MKYYLHTECQKCGKDIYELGLNLIEEKSIPVFDLDQFSQTILTCENINDDGEECGYQQGTNDIEIIGQDEG